MSEFKHSREEARKLWVEALRSGEYQQGRNYLCTESRFCCLGVACDLFIKHERLLNVRTRETGVKEFNEEAMGLPCEVQQWLGLTGKEGVYRDHEHLSRCLSAHNDSGKTFDEIASIIESNPPGLFTE